jgi:hypothetical protein
MCNESWPARNFSGTAGLALLTVANYVTARFFIIPQSKA